MRYKFLRYQQNDVKYFNAIISVVSVKFVYDIFKINKQIRFSLQFQQSRFRLIGAKSLGTKVTQNGTKVFSKNQTFVDGIHKSTNFV